MLAEVPQAANRVPAAGELFEAAMARARDAGFDMFQALVAQYELSDGQYGELADRIMGRALLLAEDLELTPAFYDDPSQMLLLVAIAERWETNETAERTGRTYRDREMLVDAAMHLAADHSAAVAEVCSQNDEARRRYYGRERPRATEYQEFLQAMTNTELSARMEEYYRDKSSQLTMTAREMFALDQDDEREPIRVAVLNMASDIDDFAECMDAVAHISPIDEPCNNRELSDTVRRVIYAKWHKSGEYTPHEVEVAADFIAACKANIAYCISEFPEAHDPNAAAWYNSSAHTIYLFAEQALAVLYKSDEARAQLARLQYEVPQLVRDRAVAAHEFGHAFRALCNDSMTYGVCPEERKAERVSGDNGGYHIVKQDHWQIDCATDNALTRALTHAVREKDARTAFVVRCANTMGLKAMWLIMADMPDHYKTRDGRYIDLSTQLDPERGELRPAATVAEDAEQLYNLRRTRRGL